MTLHLSLATEIARANVVLAAVGDAATLSIYTGALPASPDATATGTLLAQLTCGTPFGVLAAAVLTLSAISSTTAIATGTAGYGRFTSSGGTSVIDMDCGLSGGAQGIQLNDVAIVSGNTVAVTSGTLTEG